MPANAFPHISLKKSFCSVIVVTRDFMPDYLISNMGSIIEPILDGSMRGGSSKRSWNLVEIKLLLRVVP